MHHIPTPLFRSGPAFSREPALSRFHHEVAQRTANHCVGTFLMPLAFALLFVTHTDFWSLPVLARWLGFCAAAYVAIYGGVYALSVVAPFFGSNTVEAGSRAMAASTEQTFLWRVVLALVARPARVRPLFLARLTIADVLNLWLRSVLAALRARLARSAIPSLKTTAPFRLFPFAPLLLPWPLS
jgi:hypothetical protein